MNVNLFYLVVGSIAFILALITLLLGIYKDKNKIVKYVPSALTGLFTAGFFIKANYFSKGFETLGYIVFTLISGIVFIVTLLTAVIIEIVLHTRGRI